MIDNIFLLRVRYRSAFEQRDEIDSLDIVGFDFGDFVEDNDTPDPEEVAAQLLLRRDLDELLEELPPREMRVLQLRYGLDGGDPMTLKEVGRKMGITRERVRQVEAKAIRKLQHPVRARKLEGFMDHKTA